MSTAAATKLSPDVFFVHVPKTGGTSLRALLEQYHPMARIAPPDLLARAAKEQGVPRPEIVRTAEIDRLTCFYAHTNFADFLRDDLERVTVLREPMKRLLSLHNHWKSWSDREIEASPSSREVKDIKRRSREVELGAFIQIDHATVRRNFINGMTKTMVTNYPVPEHARLKGAALVEKALENLEHSMAWVGITERFDESLVVLCDRFGYPVPSGTHRLNVRRHQGYQEQPAEDPVITKALEYDRAIYRRGIEILDQSLAGLHEQHAERIAGGRTLSACVDEAVSRRWVEASSPERASEVHGSMEGALRGTGWYEREGIDTKRVYRWTGPGTVSTIEWLVRPSDAYRVDLGIVSVVDNAALKKARFSINGVQAESVEFDRRWVNLRGVEPSRRVSLVVRGRPVGEDGFCRFTIETAGVKSHAEMHHGCVDSRPKGIAVCSYSIRAL